MKKVLIAVFLILLVSSESNAMSLLGRLGVGMSSQVASGMDTLSVKIQRNRALALGGIFGITSGEDVTSYALGGKVYRLIYDEPQLNFYTAGLLAFFTYPDPTDGESTKSGHQLEGLLGSEFTFQGLESIGFSFEFGVGLVNYNDENSFRTTGHNVLKSAIHFYL